MFPPVPFKSWMMDLKTRLVERDWVKWFQEIGAALSATALRLGSVGLTAQAATVSATDFQTVSLTEGLYRVTYAARITRAATVNSSLTVALGWTDGGVSCSQSGAAMTGNTTSTTQSGIVAMHVDAATPVTYTLTYASAGATTMLYSFTAALESVPS